MLPQGLLSKRGRVVSKGRQWYHLNWGVGWAVKEAASVYWLKVIFLFSAEAQVLTRGGGGETGWCFMKEQTAARESWLSNCVYPVFLAMFLKEIIQGNNKKNAYTRGL